MELILVILISYISGSLPFGLILTKFFIKKDIRKIGSGNIGATNVFRTGNKLLALATLFLDLIKGFLPVIFVKEYYPQFIEVSCLLCFLGHVFPIWLNFKGGKGVATYLGILFAISYELGFLFIFNWIVILLIFKYSSVSSIFSSLTVFVIALIKETALPIFSELNALKIELDSTVDKPVILFIFFILIVFTHRNNISNLKNNKEQKIKI